MCPKYSEIQAKTYEQRFFMAVLQEPKIENNPQDHQTLVFKKAVACIVCAQSR